MTVSLNFIKPLLSLQTLDVVPVEEKFQHKDGFDNTQYEQIMQIPAAGGYQEFYKT